MRDVEGEVGSYAVTGGRERQKRPLGRNAWSKTTALLLTLLSDTLFGHI
jgi:hypothetical protein